jgi:hypothetical protein
MGLLERSLVVPRKSLRAILIMVDLVLMIFALIIVRRYTVPPIIEVATQVTPQSQLI